MAKPVYTLSQIIGQLTDQGGVTWSSTWHDGSGQVMGAVNGDQLVYSAGPGIQANDAAWQAGIDLAFKLWDDLVPFSIVRNDTAKNANIAIDTSSSVSGNVTNAPVDSSNPQAGHDYAIKSAAISMLTGYNDGSMGAEGWGLGSALHEIGHALGLTHPGPYNQTSPSQQITYDANAVYAQDTRQYTVMSYFGSYDTAKNAWTTDNNNPYIYATPMVDDVAAIQAKYGADFSTRSGDTTYGFHTKGLSSVEQQIFDFNYNKHPIFTIWDGGGNDTLDCSGQTPEQTINLTPGSYSSVYGMTNNVGIAYGCLIENAIGGQGNDTFILPVNLDHTVDGGGGVNTLDYSAAGTPMTFDLGAGTVSKYGNCTGGTDHFTHIQQFLAGGNDDTFVGAAGNFTLDGGVGHDALDYSFEKNGIFLSLQTGTVDKGPLTGWSINPMAPIYADGVDHIANVESFKGGAGNDTFVSAGGFFTFDGGGGTNTLDYSWDGGPITVDVKAGTVTKDFLFEPFVMGSDEFAHVQSFKGGGGDDTFVSAAGNFTFDGGGGHNTLDYSWETNAVAVDLKAGTVAKGSLVGWSINPLQPNYSDGTDHVANIESVKGGAGNDVFVTGPGNHTLDGGAGFDTLSLSGTQGDYHVHQTGATSWLIDDLRAGAPDGHTTIDHVEQLTFGNGSTMALTPTSNIFAGGLLAFLQAGSAGFGAPVFDWAHVGFTHAADVYHARAAALDLLWHNDLHTVATPDLFGQHTEAAFGTYHYGLFF